MNYALWGKMFRLCSNRRESFMDYQYWSIGHALKYVIANKTSQHVDVWFNDGSFDDPIRYGGTIAFTWYGYFGVLLPGSEISGLEVNTKSLKSTPSYPIKWQWAPVRTNRAP